MVRERPSNFTQLQIKTIDSAIGKFFGKNMTHRLRTETLDANEHVTDTTETDAVFLGELQYGPQIDRLFTREGVSDIGDGLLIVSASQTQMTLIEPTKSFIIEGTSAGTFDCWEVVGVRNTPQVDGGGVSHTEWVCRRRNQVTLT